MKQIGTKIWQFMTGGLLPWFILLLIGFLVLLTLYLRKSKQANEYNDNNKTLADSLHTSLDRNNEQIATIRSFSVLKASDLSQIVTKDSTINLLKHFVDSLQKAKTRVVTATVVKTVTVESGSSKTRILNKPVNLLDSVKNRITYWPVYFSQWNEKWSYGSITATKDSITRNIHIHNEYETSVNYTRKNIFSPWIPTVMIKNINPYSTTTDLRSVLVSPKATRWGIGASLIGTYINGGIKPVFGVGINYNLFTF